MDVGGHEGRHAEEHESETVEEPRERQGVHGLEASEHEPPHQGRDTVRPGHDVELVGRLARLAGEQHDLVRVGGQDLAQGEDERVDGPVSQPDGEELLETLRRLVSGAEEELVVAVVLVAPAHHVVLVLVRGGQAVDADHAGLRLAILLDQQASAGSGTGRPARTAAAAQFRIAEGREPLLLARFEVVLDAEIRVRVLGREGAELLLECLVVLSGAVREEGIDLLELEVVAVSHDVDDGKAGAVAILVDLRGPGACLRVVQAKRLGSRLGAIGRHHAHGEGIDAEAVVVRIVGGQRSQTRHRRACRLVAEHGIRREEGLVRTIGRRGRARGRVGLVGEGVVGHGEAPVLVVVLVARLGDMRHGKSGCTGPLEGSLDVGVVEVRLVAGYAEVGMRGDSEERSTGQPPLLLGLLEVRLDGGALERVEIFHPLLDGESLLGTPSPHLLPGLGLALEGSDNGLAELVQEMLRSRRLDGVPETGHLTETTHTGTDTERALAAELDRDETEGLVTGRDEGEFGTAEDVRREGGELGLAVDAARVLLHQLLELEGGELSVQIDDGSDADELRLGVLLQDGREDIGDEIDTFLQRPAADEDEQLRLGVDIQVCPLLRLLPELATLGLGFQVDHDVFLVDLFVAAPLGRVAGIRVGQLSDLGKSPEDGITSVGAVAVLLGHTDRAKALLVHTEIRGTSVEQVEHGTELDVLLDDLGVEVEDLADFLGLLGRPHGPHALELGVVQGQGARDGAVRQEIERSRGAVVVVDVVQIRVEATDGLGDAVVPSRVVDSGVDIIHAGRIRVGLGLLAEDRGVQQNVRDVLDLVVLDLDLVLLAHDGNVHGLGALVDGIVDTADAGDHPDQILVLESFAHELGHDTETTDLDLDVPVVDVVLHGRDDDLPPLAGDRTELHSLVLVAEALERGAAETIAQIAERRTATLLEADLVDLDLVEGAHEDPDRDQAADDRERGQEDEDDDLDPHVALGLHGEVERRVVKDELVRERRQRWCNRGVEHVEGEGAGGHAIENAIQVHITIDPRGIRFPVGVHAPYVELELGRPLVHEVQLPGAIVLQAELVVDPSVEPKLIEGAVGEDVRETSRRLGAAVSLLLEAAATQGLGKVLDDDVISAPGLEGRPRPRQVIDLLLAAAIQLPIAVGGTPVGGITPLGGAGGGVVDEEAAALLGQESRRVVRRGGEHDRVVRLPNPQEQMISRLGGTVLLGGRRILDGDGVHTVVDIRKSRCEPEVGVDRAVVRNNLRVRDVCALDGSGVQSSDAAALHGGRNRNRFGQPVAVHRL